MRYLGNKTKLIGNIKNVIEKYKIEGEVFGDLFAGTGSVGDSFKDQYKIISNDFLYYSYILNYAKIKNCNIPKFEKFREYYFEDIFEWLNNKEYIPQSNYFFYWNYSPKGGRMYFTEENAILIDGIRQEIEHLYRNSIVDLNEYNFLLASLIESVSRYSNTSGTYEAYFKFWDARALKQFVLEPLEFNHVDYINDSEIFCQNTNDLAKDISGDIAYIDTPYTVTQYVSAYHMFETLVRYDEPQIKGIGGKRERGNKNSLYSQKTKALSAFQDLLRKLDFKHIIISYSNHGIIELNEMAELASKFAKDKKVHIETKNYQQYRNHRGKNKTTKLNEVILYFEKDISINKSPLNYSGSKDTLIKPLINELPKEINTFVDVMGGAFNVGANIFALDKIIYNEINPYIYSLVKWLIENDKEKVVNATLKIIENYNLSKGYKEGFINLRKDYNINKTPDLLFVLHMYSFQNIIRYNNKQEFNTPIGVAGYSKDMEKRILQFIPKTREVEFWNKDYTDISWKEFNQNTVFYFDPPYFITQAAYNDGKRGMKGWSIDSELELLDVLNYIDTLGHKFMLSNVIEHNGKSHDILINWIKEHGFNIKKIGTTGLRYRKNEILITNY